MSGGAAALLDEGFPAHASGTCCSGGQDPVRRVSVLLLALMGGAAGAQDGARPGFRDTPLLPGTSWHVHDSARPDPPVVSPGTEAGKPPSDAVVLFDGTSLSAWQAQATPWRLAGGTLTAPTRAKGQSPSPIDTVEGFGDMQLHLEFRIPPPDGPSGQDRGNSGIWFMQRYEVQILDSYGNPTYADGTVGALGAGSRRW